MQSFVSAMPMPLPTNGPQSQLASVQRVPITWCFELIATGCLTSPDSFLVDATALTHFLVLLHMDLGMSEQLREQP
jgi:hypothetical protein